MSESFSAVKKKLPFMGVGLGYRMKMADATLQSRDSIDFLEIIQDHYLDLRAAELKELERASDFPLIAHGVELSIGNVAQLDIDYLKKLSVLFRRINSPWWSDHLCFTGVEGNRLHDLLPLPFTREAVDHVVKRVKKIREIIDLPFLLENVSSYIQLPGAEMTEAQFVSEIVEKADCGLLLDVNNVYVTSFNLKYDPVEFISQLPLERVVQIHIAGHRKTDSVIFDTHGAKVTNPVYDLLSLTLSKTDAKAILLERDQLFPKFSSILAEIAKIRKVAGQHQPEFLKPLRSASRK